MSQTSRLIMLPLSTWIQVEAREPAILRPAPGNTTVQPSGQIYCFPGNSPPPEAATASNFTGIPSSGFGTFTLATPGNYQLLYTANTGGTFPMIYEPLDGRTAPAADEDSAGFFYRRAAVGSGSGITLTDGTANTAIFGINPRRKALLLNMPDATAGGALYLRYDGSAPTVTNHDLFIDLTATRALQLTGPDIPKGGIAALFWQTGVSGTTILITGSQWE